MKRIYFIQLFTLTLSGVVLNPCFSDSGTVYLYGTVINHHYLFLR